LQVDAIGSEPVIKTLDKSNKTVRVEHTCERVSKEGSVELFKLGRKNFKPEYKTLKQVYPDIDKISKEVHFTIKWIRVFTNDRSQLSEVSNRKLEKG
jgi:exo-beta-1,3-glucanase (GH17 family)